MRALLAPLSLVGVLGLGSGCRSAGQVPSAAPAVRETPPAARPPAATAPTAQKAQTPGPVLAAAGERPPRSCTLTPGTEQVERRFGGEHLGFPVWVSANGRLAILYQFRTDNDGDGKIDPHFGHHGEPLGDRWQPFLFDLSTGTEEAFDDVLTAESGGRFAVLQRGSSMWLIDAQSGTSTDLTKAGATEVSDDNACLPPRAAAFGDSPGFLTLFRGPQGERAVLYNLLTAEEKPIAAGPGLVWRAEPSSRAGWAVVRSVLSDTTGDGKLSLPRQRTSCACRVCKRFALSYGVYGWSGDAFSSFLVAPDGTRVEMKDGHLVPLGTRHVFQPRGSKVLTLAGSPAALPAGCQARHLPLGSATILLRCADGEHLLNMDTGRDQRLGPDPLDLLTGPASEVSAWIAGVRTRNSGKELVRLDLGSGALQPIGPVTALEEGATHGWLTAATPTGVIALHAESGAVLTASLPGAAEPDQLSVSLGGEREKRWAVLSPTRCRYLETTQPPRYVTRDGCTLRSAEPGEASQPLSRGPWQLVCPAP